MRNQEAERKRQEEIEKAQKEAEEELKAEEQKTQTSKGSRRNIIKPVDCPNSDEQANKIDKMLQEMQEEK